MNFLIGLIAPKLGPRMAGLVVYGGLVLLIVGALLWWGHTKYRAGVRDTDAKWEEAGRKLQQQAAASAAKADGKAAARVEEFTRRVEDEKEKLDEAEREGRSPLDVLFGT